MPTLQYTSTKRSEIQSKNSPAANKKCAAPKNAIVKKDMKSKVAAKKWL